MGEYLQQQYQQYRNSIEELNDIEKKIRLNKIKNFNIKH